MIENRLLKISKGKKLALNVDLFQNFHQFDECHICFDLRGTKGCLVLWTTLAPFFFLRTKKGFFFVPAIVPQNDLLCIDPLTKQLFFHSLD